MSSYLFCGTYQDLTCNLRTCRGRIGIEFKAKQGADASMYFSLNPMQAKIFAENLRSMALNVPIKEIQNIDSLGDLEVHTEIEKKIDTQIYHREEYPVA